MKQIVIQLPPEPNANDFRDHSGYVDICYYDALRAWKEVCLAIVKAQQSSSEPVDAPASAGV